MPKIIAHALTGATIVTIVFPNADLTKWSLFLGAVLAISPDFDLAVEWLFDIPDLHRGFSHSLLASLVVGVTISLLTGAAEQRLALGYGLAYLSHSLLDLATSTEGGVKLFYPLSGNYYHLGLTKILELPFGPAPREIITWVVVETVIFLPIFLIALFIKKSIN